jgi:hypothetical protein
MHQLAMKRAREFLVGPDEQSALTVSLKSISAFTRFLTCEHDAKDGAIKLGRLYNLKERMDSHFRQLPNKKGRIPIGKNKTKQTRRSNIHRSITTIQEGELMPSSSSGMRSSIVSCPWTEHYGPKGTVLPLSSSTSSVVPRLTLQGTENELDNNRDEVLEPNGVGLILRDAPSSPHRLESHRDLVSNQNPTGFLSFQSLIAHSNRSTREADSQGPPFRPAIGTNPSEPLERELRLISDHGMSVYFPQPEECVSQTRSIPPSTAGISDIQNFDPSGLPRLQMFDRDQFQDWFDYTEQVHRLSCITGCI